MAEIKTEFRYATAGSTLLLWMGRIMGSGLVILGLWFIFGHVENGLYAGIMMAGLGAGFAWYGHWYHKRVTTDREVKLAITPEGIRAPVAAAKTVPWADIEKVILVSSRPKKPGYLALGVKDPMKYEPTKGTMAMAKLNRTFGGGELIVRHGELDGSLEEIRAAILATRPDAPLVDK